MQPTAPVGLAPVSNIASLGLTVGDVHLPQFSTHSLAPALSPQPSWCSLADDQGSRMMGCHWTPGLRCPDRNWPVLAPGPHSFLLPLCLALSQDPQVPCSCLQSALSLNLHFQNVLLAYFVRVSCVLPLHGQPLLPFHGHPKTITQGQILLYGPCL